MTKDQARMVQFANLPMPHRAVLLRIVAEGCRWLDCWGTSCTAFFSWGEVATPATLTAACRELVAKGWIVALGADDLGLYRPTVAGVQVVAAWLRFFVTEPPAEVCADA